MRIGWWYKKRASSCKKVFALKTQRVYTPYMPRKRKAGKEPISAWISDDLKKKLEAMAAEQKVPLATVVENILKEQAAIYGKQNSNDKSQS